VPQRQRKRGRLWLADGSCLRLRPEHANHVWAYDFVEDRTREGRTFRMLCVVDEFTREALAIRVARRLSSSDVIDTLADLFIARGAPAHIRSDQGPEFVAEAVKAWITCVGTKTAYIEKASPWENGYVESFNGKLRDELLNGEVFNTLKEAQVLIEEWRRHYNRVRPHSSLGYRPPRPGDSANGRVADQLGRRPGCDGPLQFRPDHSMGAGQCCCGTSHRMCFRRYCCNA
jgi:transposase InsO family protein